MKITLAVYNFTFTGRASLPKWPAEPTEVAGLAVCREPKTSPIAGTGLPASDGTWMIPLEQEDRPSRYYYQVIHVPSGMSVIGCLLNHSLAHVLANRLGAIAWTVSEEAIRANYDDYKRLVKSVWGGVT